MAALKTALSSDCVEVLALSTGIQLALFSFVQFPMGHFHRLEKRDLAIARVNAEFQSLGLGCYICDFVVLHRHASKRVFEKQMFEAKQFVRSAKLLMESIHEDLSGRGHRSLVITAQSRHNSMLPVALAAIHL